MFCLPEIKTSIPGVKKYQDSQFKRLRKSSILCEQKCIDPLRLTQQRTMWARSIPSISSSLHLRSLAKTRKTTGYGPDTSLWFALRASSAPFFERERAAGRAHSFTQSQFLRLTANHAASHALACHGSLPRLLGCRKNLHLRCLITRNAKSSMHRKWQAISWVSA